MCLLGDLFLSLFSSKATEMNHLSACLVNSPMPSDLLWALSGSFGAAPGLGLTPPLSRDSPGWLFWVTSPSSQAQRPDLLHPVEDGK